VVSTSFADIFKQNSLKNGLLPIVVPAGVHAVLVAARGAIVTVDLAAQTLTLADGRSVQFPIDPFSKHCLLEGVDELGYILQQEHAIAAYEARAGRLA
jgi:3-isopropylmalate/(R)-2-methylmalate dehydratase small subunit